ncbi:Os03g0248250 [Oryza sativa Japonica Group]|uniref:Os03g0248250 protein n=1 Tax=Oryza sativa subsp. japonica TaxID=39947 RepID=A0A0P0VVS2_ORYSJ|nr:hypothetical protein EE612_016495 [Oryza sativa]BAS83266.1 Os03g0248250 [Oryza sativa Japonica Group]
MGRREYVSTYLLDEFTKCLGPNCHFLFPSSFFPFVGTYLQGRRLRLLPLLFLSLLGGKHNILPKAVLELTTQDLRQIRVSPRKASYLHDLARKYTSGILSNVVVVNMNARSLACLPPWSRALAPEASTCSFFPSIVPMCSSLPTLGCARACSMSTTLMSCPSCRRWTSYEQ